MTQTQVVAYLDDCNTKGTKLNAVRALYYITRGTKNKDGNLNGLREAKDIADLYFKNPQFGELSLNYIKSRNDKEDRVIFLKNVRNLKEHHLNI